MTSGEENSPLGPHRHFHLFHLVGQANPKNQGRKKKKTTVSRVSAIMRYKSI